MLLMRCSVSLGFIWHTFIIFSSERWRTAAFSGPYQANYWDFKRLHTLSRAESDGFYHIQAENGFGLWQHFHPSDSPGAVWISGCGKSLVQEESNSSWTVSPLLSLLILLMLNSHVVPQFPRSFCACWGKWEDVGYMEKAAPWWLIIWKTKKSPKVFEGQVLPGALWITITESSLAGGGSLEGCSNRQALQRGSWCWTQKPWCAEASGGHSQVGLEDKSDGASRAACVLTASSGVCSGSYIYFLFYFSLCCRAARVS